MFKKFSITEFAAAKRVALGIRGRGKTERSYTRNFVVLLNVIVLFKPYNLVNVILTFLLRFLSITLQQETA